MAKVGYYLPKQVTYPFSNPHFSTVLGKFGSDQEHSRRLVGTFQLVWTAIPLHASYVFALALDHQYQQEPTTNIVRGDESHDSTITL